MLAACAAQDRTEASQGDLCSRWTGHPGLLRPVQAAALQPLLSLGRCCRHAGRTCSGVGMLPLAGSV